MCVPPLKLKPRVSNGDTPAMCVGYERRLGCSTVQREADCAAPSKLPQATMVPFHPSTAHSPHPPHNVTQANQHSPAPYPRAFHRAPGHASAPPRRRAHPQETQTQSFISFLFFLAWGVLPNAAPSAAHREPSGRRDCPQRRRARGLAQRFHSPSSPRLLNPPPDSRHHCSPQRHS